MTNKKPQLNDWTDDDEFQEFQIQDWTEQDEDHSDAQLWIENWDDDNLDDDFSKQLRQEIAKLQEKQ
jgi:26 proteasome complex subunit DSS1